MGLIKEFKEFAMKGNVMDMAVGIIIGGAFGKIVSSMVNDIIMPPIGIILGGVNFKNLSLVLKKASAETPAITLNYGSFLNTVADFIIISFSIFIMVKWMNKLRKKEEAKPDKKPEKPAEDIIILKEIRDALQKKT